MTETRLDRLWQAVAADPGNGARWLAFYEGLAAQMLSVPLEDDEEAARPQVLMPEGGPVVLAFDSEERLAAAMGRATARAELEGRDLARFLAEGGLGLALNPGTPASETVLTAATVAWIAGTLSSEPVEETGAGRLRPPGLPDPALLEALGARIADFGTAAAEAWLCALDRPEGEALLLLLRPAADLPPAIAREMAGSLVRLGQGLAEVPFGVALEDGGTPRLSRARAVGIGIGIAGG